MAKKVKTESEPEVEKNNVVDNIRKKYGEGIINSARSFSERTSKIISVSPAHDIALGGGIPQGSWVNIAGKPKTHKSTTCLHIARNCQQQGMTIYYGNVEGRLKKRDIPADIDLDKFHIIESSEEKFMTAVDYLTVFEDILKSTKESVLIIDSVSMLADEKEIEGGIGTSTRGGGAKYLAQFCRNMAGVVPVRNHIVIGILQLMANTSGYGSPFQEKGGNSIVYQADVRLIVKASELLEVNDKVVGANVKWLTLASALGTPPGQEYVSTIRYGKGIDAVSELVQMAESVGIVEKAGAWYKWEEVKAQGLEKFRELIDEDKSYHAKLLEQLQEYIA